MTLLKKGWRPKRTIFLCAWDGEEQGLLGSTEWMETHADELRQKAVVYINSDSNERGFLYAGGSHTLEPFVTGVASAITDPERQIPVSERLRLSRIHDAATADARREIRDRKSLSIEALGSGSDFTPFLQHLGIASLNLGYGGEGEEGVYHSIYDDFSWYSRFADTDFVYGRSLAQTIGTALMRLADADLLPLDPTPLSDTVAGYVKEVRTLAQEKRDAAEELARQIDEGVPLAAADPRLPFVAPKKEAVPPYFDFSPLENASADLARAAKEYQAALSAAGPDLASDAARVARVNAALRADRAVPDAGGGPAGAALVPALRLRAGLLHRLLRQDAAGRARGPRTEAVGERQRPDRRDRAGPPEGGGDGGRGDEGVEGGHRFSRRESPESLASLGTGPYGATFPARICS